MTPSARISAAIEILDKTLSGTSAERCLTNWARGNRFAGSKDRRAIRDHVFDALRCLRSYAWLGGAGDVPPAQMSGRAVMIGALRARGIDPASVFDGQGYGPAPLDAAEQHGSDLDWPDLADAPRGARLDCPDWLLARFDAALGEGCDAELALTQRRSPVFLRVNRRKSTLGHAIELLAEDAITAVPHPLSESALEVTDGARAVARSQAYLTGVVELQDAGAQAVLDLICVEDGNTVLDYCAGGGGKALALAAKADVRVSAHDIDFSRMQDITPRATRAGVKIDTLRAADLAPAYDVVVADVPCSGSGSWSRAPQAKWLLDQARLDELTQTQAQILDDIAPRVAAGGVLAYITCSLFDAENSAIVDAFLARAPAFHQEATRTVRPSEGGDGFYFALLRKTTA